MKLGQGVNASRSHHCVSDISGSGRFFVSSATARLKRLSALFWPHIATTCVPLSLAAAARSG